MPSKKRKAAAAFQEQEKHFSGTYKQRLRRRKDYFLPPSLPDEEGKKCTFKTPFPQQFSFPENIVFYVAKNPISLWGQQNLIKTCKLLFRMSQILPVRDASCLIDSSMMVSLKREWSPEKKAFYNLQNQSMPIKFWIHHQFSVQPNIKSDFISTMIHNIYQCSLQRLVIHNQNFIFRELQLLTFGGKLQSIIFVKNVVKNCDGSVTEFEKIFELLLCKNMKIELSRKQHGIYEDTATKMAEILETAKFSCIELRNIPESFDFQTFSGFLRINMLNQMHTFDLHFSASIPFSYKTQLDQFINEIIQRQYARGRSVPYISFSGVNSDTPTQLLLMRYC